MLKTFSVHSNVYLESLATGLKVQRAHSVSLATKVVYQVALNLDHHKNRLANTLHDVDSADDDGIDTAADWGGPSWELQIRL